MSSSSSSSSSSGGIGFFGALGLLFIALKLLGFIDWSWWLVLLPLYGGVLAVILIMVGAVGIAIAVEARRDARIRRDRLNRIR